MSIMDYARGPKPGRGNGIKIWYFRSDSNDISDQGQESMDDGRYIFFENNRMVILLHLMNLFVPTCKTVFLKDVHLWKNGFLKSHHAKKLKV